MDDQDRPAIAALQQGNIAGLEHLVRRYQSDAIRLAFGLTGDRAVAEDVVADAFLAVYEHRDRFDPRRPFAPWFYRIVVNGARGVWRKRRRTVPLEGEAEGDAQAGSTATTPEAETIWAETRRTLAEAVLALPTKQREVVVLRYYLDMDERAIAQTLACPWPTVRWRLHAARQRLARALPPDIAPGCHAVREKGEMM